MTRCLLGIDPGEDMPIAAGEVDAVNLARRVAAMAPDLVFLERVNAMPGQGVSSTFKFGRAYGVVLGVIGAAALPLHLVTPAKWKGHLRLSSDKEEARALALRLFPACADHFKRKKDHGRAEAALIARYGAETMRLIGGGA
ncbi:hypothetical protein [Bradyrhizobium sp. 1200_D9_N1_1]|uniref:hypothetical protein n=1 Tax=Bradyrhizobium sp. 1200_D9_N1_1 TaxID=3239013 RepID=UPI003D5C88CC